MQAAARWDMLRFDLANVFEFAVLVNVECRWIRTHSLSLSASQPIYSPLQLTIPRC